MAFMDKLLSTANMISASEHSFQLPGQDLFAEHKHILKLVKLGSYLKRNMVGSWNEFLAVDGLIFFPVVLLVMITSTGHKNASSVYLKIYWNGNLLALLCWMRKTIARILSLQMLVSRIKCSLLYEGKLKLESVRKLTLY